MNKTIFTILAFLTISLSVSGQVTAPVGNAKDSTSISQVIDPSLQGQYQTLLAKSKMYYGSKLINPSRLAAFYRNVADSIRKERTTGRAGQAKLAEQAKLIDSLNNQIKASEVALATKNNQADSMSFLGISSSKSTYSLIVWSIILALGLALAFVISRSASNIREAKYRTELYEEISGEYQSYKSRTNEKEKKLARELQDERNKLEEYKTGGHK